VETRKENSAAEHEALAAVAACFVRHVAPSVQLGVGRLRASAPLKLHAVAHALRLVTLSVQSLCRLFKSISAVLTDQGTERAFANTAPVPLLQLVPPPPPQECAVEVDMAPVAGDPAELELAPELAEPKPEDLMLDVRSSFEVNDLLHAIHNATGGLSGVMRRYTDVVFQCKKLSDFLRRKETKEKLIETCFSHGVGRTLAPGIRHFVARVHEERWGTVADCIPKLCKLRNTLQYGWNLERFCGMPEEAALQAAEDAGEDAEGAAHDRLDVVHRAIGSAFFWGYLNAIQGIADSLTKCMAWAESCPCHWGLDCDTAGKELQELWGSCPMRRRRCPELAAGDFMDELKRSLATTAAEVALGLPVELSAQERADILLDVEAGRGHLLFYFQMKLHHWTEPPWCLFAMAHPCGDVAMKAEERARLSTCQHPRVMQLRHEPLRSQVQAWREAHGALGITPTRYCIQSIWLTCSRKRQTLAPFLIKGHRLVR
jgi:hypothetical protein